ncbi:hypothetical protein D3C80_2188850 [compost metagenome]
MDTMYFQLAPHILPLIHTAAISKSAASIFKDINNDNAPNPELIAIPTKINL